MAHVFRVEHEDGIGCYYHRSRMHGFLDDMHHRHNADTEMHPSPFNDIKIDRSMHSDEFCGFESMESLEQWFTENDLIKLDQLGFSVIELNGVEITAVGEKQVLFTKSDPEKISEEI